MSTAIKIVSLLGSVAFGLFAYLQFNDFDPDVYVDASRVDAWEWAGFYALISLLFLLAVFGKHSRIALAIGALCCLIQMARTVPGVIENLRGDDFVLTQEQMSPGNTKVELSREFGGALISLAGLAFLFAQTTACCRRRCSPAAQQVIG
jgi:hypothetical protein